MPLTRHKHENKSSSSGGYPPHLLGSYPHAHMHIFLCLNYQTSGPRLHLLFFSPPLSPATNLLSLPCQTASPKTPLTAFQKLKRNCYCSTLLLRHLLCHVIDNIIILLGKIFTYTYIQQLPYT